MYDFCILQDMEKSKIIKCVNETFSDYYCPIRFNEDSFLEFINNENIEMNKSYGIICDDELIGFIFNSFGLYNRKKAVFMAGAGIMPSYRGQGLFSKLFDHVEENLRKEFNYYFLEVIKENNYAIKTYKKSGFKINRTFKIFKSNKESSIIDNGDIEVRSISCNILQQYNELKWVEPSFENSFNNNDISEYKILGVFSKGQIKAACAFSDITKEIKLLGFIEEKYLIYAINNLLEDYNNILIKNIDIKYTKVIDILFILGFNCICEQYEMIKYISD